MTFLLSSAPVRSPALKPTGSALSLGGLKACMNSDATTKLIQRQITTATAETARCNETSASTPRSCSVTDTSLSSGSRSCGTSALRGNAKTARPEFESRRKLCSHFEATTTGVKCMVNVMVP